MKKIMKTLTIVIGCAMTMAVLTACSDNTDNPAPKPEQESQAEYTIMFYTAGARNIDPNMLNVLSSFYDANPEAYKKVNVVIQYKYSTTENLNKTLGSFGSEFCTTFGSKSLRWTVDPAKKFDEEAFDQGNIYGADNADILTSVRTVS